MASAVSPPTLLVADIGGTNTRIALTRGADLRTDSVKRFRNADFDSLGSVLLQYLDQQSEDRCDGVCVAVAGPVRGGVGALTNLSWSIDAPTLSKAAGTDNVAILNDLQAQGYALGRVNPENLTSVLPGKPAAPNASQLVIGVGTGFNAAVVHETGAGRAVIPSECGHMSLPVHSDDQIRMSRHIEARHHGFTAVEDVLSGRGLERVCSWIALEDGEEDVRKAADIMADAAKREARALATVRHVCTLLGTVAGDLALVHLPFGGIHLVGGVARALAPYLASEGFSDAFHDKGRFAEFMAGFPVDIVFDDYAALTGCAAHLLKNQTT
ncbi:glucokinase [Aliiroseovarius sp. YM-037]|uniref:glucokinase n=1 Tax=Aliiroseovarius sp. YM-037 TaxID=3341728 RepID=UPI003A80E4C0